MFNHLFHISEIDNQTFRKMIGKGCGFFMPQHDFRLLMCSLDLPQFDSIEDLSNLTGLSSNLLFCLSQRQSNYYRVFTIPKRDGSKREIYAPSYSLHIVQRWILKNILEKISPSKYAMAFRSGSDFGCKANALHHAETYYGVSFDLKDFFPSIDARRVYNVFRNIGYFSRPAAILTNLCTLDQHLPQGGACSPALSNLVCLSLDARLGGLCEKRNIRFSRYADDMYFSCDSQDVLKKCVPIIKNIIESEDFVINDNKTHFYTPSNHKRITGITIIQAKNEQRSTEIKASKELKRKIRSEIFKAMYVGDYSKKEHIMGEIAYVNHIENDYAIRVRRYIANTTDKIKMFPELVKLYNENKFFKDMPVLQYREGEILEELGCKGSQDDKLYMLYSMYLNRKNYLQIRKEKDVCKYEKWKKLFTNIDDILDTPFLFTDESEVPF